MKRSINYLQGKILFQGVGKQLRRILVLVITVALVTSSFVFSNVSAYYTAGALGRSLNVATGFTVYRNLLAPLAPAGVEGCREGQLLKDFAGVTIHETSNWSANANALMHAQYLRGGGQNIDVSWHYAVDSTCAYQSIPENEKAWHAGDTANGKGNAETIAIEICDNPAGNFDQAMANAEWLAADVLYRHGVYTVNGYLYQHHDFSAYGKNCPITIRDKGRWPEFCSKTQGYLNQMVTANGEFQVSSSNGEIKISGKPSNFDSISRVDIYADNNRGVGSVLIKNGGFSFDVDPSFFTAGWHTFMFAMIRYDGSVVWSNCSYLIPEAVTNIEASSISQINTGDITVSGWTVSHVGVSRVDVYIDNYQGLGTAQQIERTDVNTIVNATGEYRDALHSGFSYTIDATQLTAGKHIVRVAAISNDGSVQWTAREFIVGPEAVTNIEASSISQINTGDITVSGWTVSHVGVSRVDIYLDNYQGLGTAQQIDRNDVNTIVNVTGEYRDALHSGFSYKIDATQLTAGKHVVRVAAISNDGSVQWTVREFTVG